MPTSLGLLALATTSAASSPVPPAPDQPLPPWPPTYDMARSVVAFPANFTSYYDVQLASKFGLNMFDQSNGQLLWSANVHHYNDTNDMEAFLLRQIAMVKAINPHSRSFIYRSGQCAISYASVFREAIQDPSKAGMWIKYQKGDKKGQVYWEKSPGPFCPVPATAENASVPPPLPGGWWGGRMPAGVECGDDYFFDFTNADARAFFTTTALRLGDHRVDGFFFDDVEGLGTEHGALIKTTGMTPDQVAAWNAARLPVYADMHKALAADGKFEWHMFVDADGNPPRTIGAMSIPTNTTCAAWMRRSCAKSYEDVPLMMTLSNHFKDRFPGARPGSVLPKPYTFTWFEQQLAAFLLIRGRYAFFGTGWGVGLVHEWQSMYDTDFGVPMRNGTADGGVCLEVSPGVFHRPWSKYNITLDCNSWLASFVPL